MKTWSPRPPAYGARVRLHSISRMSQRAITTGSGKSGSTLGRRGGQPADHRSRRPDRRPPGRRRLSAQRAGDRRQSADLRADDHRAGTALRRHKGGDTRAGRAAGAGGARFRDGGYSRPRAASLHVRQQDPRGGRSRPVRAAEIQAGRLRGRLGGCAMLGPQAPSVRSQSPASDSPRCWVATPLVRCQRRVAGPAIHSIVIRVGFAQSCFVEQPQGEFE